MILLSLPFNYGLTLQIGFNFKIYEIVFLIYLLVSIICTLYSGTISVKLQEENFDINIIVSVLFCSFVLSNLIAFYYFNINIGDAGIYYQWAVGRFSPFLNSPIAVAYVVFSLLIFLFFLHNISQLTINSALKVWVAGAVLCVVYLAYCNVALFVGLPEILLPGMDEGFQFGNVFGREIIRSGTFKEGNFLSGYLLASSVFSYYLYLNENRIRYLFFSLIFTSSIFLTLSTVGVILIFLFWILYFSANMLFIRKISRQALFKSLIIIISVVVLLNVSGIKEYFSEIIIEKVIYTDIAESSTAYSKFDRIDSLIKAVEIFFDYPLSGVGTYNFGYYYPLYWTEELFPDGTEFKKIPNNVYIQLLCENGIIVIIPFLIFFAIIFRRFIRIKQKKKEHLLMISLFLAILIKWNAYPSYTLVYDWVSFSIIAFSFGNCRYINIHKYSAKAVNQ